MNPLRSFHFTPALFVTLFAFAAAASAAPAGATLWGMGRSYNGALGPSGANFLTTPRPLGTHVRAAAAGVAHTLFLTDDGTLWGVGSNQYGQLGLGASRAGTATPERLAADVIAIAAGYYHTLFLTRDHTLWGVGGNGVGQLGDGTAILRYKPVHVAANVITMAGGYSHTLFVTTDGTLWATGANAAGQLGNGTTTDSLTPVAVASGVTAVSAGAYFSLFLKTDGSLWTMGDNVSGQLGDGTTTPRSTPAQVATGVAAISAGGYFSAFVKTDATLWACGDNAAGQLGTGNTTEVHTPVQLATGVSAVATGQSHTLFRKTDATVWATGSNYARQQGDNAPLDQRVTPAQVATGIAAVFAGGTHTLFLRPDGTLLGVGNNRDGQLGGGGSVAQATPLRIADDVIAVSAGSDHTAFLKADGTLWASGNNDYGQLGDGTTRSRPEPALLASDVAAVATGTTTTFFIKNDATLWATGENLRGQLGDGTTTARSTPVQIATGVTAVRASSTTTLFLKTDRTLWGMGWNQLGEIDASGTLNLSTPVLVATDVVTMDAGQSVTVYITTDSVLHARGDMVGGLGRSNPSVARTPVDLMADAADVSVGYRFALVRKTDNSLWVMGQNSDGQLGLTQMSLLGVPYTTRSQPDPVQLTTGVAAIAAGYAHSTFLRTDGTLWTMGKNTDGQLGNGTTANSEIPVLVASGVAQVAAGTVDTFFLQPAAPAVTTQPAGGPLGHGVTLSVVATGPAPLNYQWFLNDAPIAGATSATFAASAPGSYRVLVGGTTWSDPAVLTVPNRLINLSARAHAGTGDRILITGFVISGPTGTAKSLLLRGVGPTPAQFGVSPVLAQPSLALFSQGPTARPSGYLRHAIIYDGPGNGDYLAYPFDIPGLAAQVGAFPLLPADANSTRPDLLPRGGYSLQVFGADGGEGLALAELYEVDADPLPVVNLSARGWAARGDDTLIAGFVLAGSQPAALLLRGVGPALAGLGVTGALGSPALTLYDAHGQRVAANTGWGTAANPAAIALAASTAGAFTLPAGSADSALLVTLEPGIYTVHVTPAADTAPGIALVEIYLVP